MAEFINKVKKRFGKKVKIGINPSFETEKAEIHIGHNYNITINQFGGKTDPKKILESFEKEQILTRDDLLLPDIEQTETVITRSQLLLFYRPHLSKKDLAALNDSLSIIALEDKELNDENKTYTFYLTLKEDTD